MMKRITIIIAIIVASLTTNATAQRYVVRDVAAIEFELNVGLATAANQMPQYGNTRQGVDANIELRYNFATAPVDLGLYYSICSLRRGESVGNMAKNFAFDSQNLLVTSDYIFYQGRNVQPYAGLGVGLAWSDINTDGSIHGTHFAVMPRVGIEIVQRLRISLGYKLFDRANNHLVLGIGLVFGGGLR